MSDLFDRRKVPLHVQIAAAEREVRQRRHVYPRRVADGKMTQAFADEQTAAMEAIVETLKGLQS
jgi:hypothetical protein